MTDSDDPFLYFYENFLAAYNAKLRKTRGVYYTPLPVVRFIVRAVDDILKGDFGMKNGLADKSVTRLGLCHRHGDIHIGNDASGAK